MPRMLLTDDQFAEFSSLMEKARAVLPTGEKMLEYGVLETPMPVEVLRHFISIVGWDEYDPKYAPQVRYCIIHLRELDRIVERDSRKSSPRGFTGKSSVSHRKQRV